MNSESDGKEPAGFILVPKKVQVVRGEFLQELLRAGIEVRKTNINRGCIQGRDLSHSWITLREELKDECVGVYHGTTYRGEVFCITLRYVKSDLTIILRLQTGKVGISDCLHRQ